MFVVRAEEEAAAASPASDNVRMDGFTADDEKKLSESTETFTFQAEVNRLMDIIINSLCKPVYL